MNDLTILPNMTPAQKAEKLIKITNLKKEVDEAYKQLREDLLEETRKLDIYSLKTGAYTITRAKRITPSVVDFETLKVSLEQGNIPYTTKTVFGDEMTEVFKQAVKEGRELNGLEAKESEYVTVKVKENK